MWILSDIATNYLKGIEDTQEIMILKYCRMTDLQFKIYRNTLNEQVFCFAFC